MNLSPKPTALIIGATSDIARATARVYAANGYQLSLACRNPDALAPDLADLQVRYGIQVTCTAFDILKRESHVVLLDALPLPDVVICVIGRLGEQGISEQQPSVADEVMRTNYNEPSLLLAEFANRMEKRGSGVIIGISSVAGDRGRASNYIYGSAKAGFTAFLSGLRNRLTKKNVHVMTVKPGFVRTRMTEGMNLPAKLTAEPREVAEAIFSGQKKKRNVVYVRPVWWLVMLVITHLPEFVFKRTKL